MKTINKDMSLTDQIELIGRLIDVVEDWLSCWETDQPIIVGDDYDELAANFKTALGFSDEEEQTPEMESWAEREVRIACEKENPDRKDGEWDYGCVCYESALKAYKSLADDGHSGFSIGLTKHILNRLIDHKTLSPIEDTEDAWYTDRIDTSHHRGEEANYQCSRMSSLFKYVYADGSIIYRDVDRTVEVLKRDDGSESWWSSGLASQIVDDLFPITMPYYPADKPFKVYCEQFLTDPKNGDWDTTGVLYLITPGGERIDIQRYFKEDEESGKDIEIDDVEYEQRRSMAQEREKND